MPRSSLRGRNKKYRQIRSWGEGKASRYVKDKTSGAYCSNVGHTLARLPRPKSTKFSKPQKNRRKFELVYNGDLHDIYLPNFLS